MVGPLQFHDLQHLACLCYAALLVLASAMAASFLHAFLSAYSLSVQFNTCVTSFFFFFLVCCAVHSIELN